MATTAQPQQADTSSSLQVESRATVSAPGRVIQVEQVRISEHHKSAVATAIRTGRAAKSDSQ